METGLIFQILRFTLLGTIGIPATFWILSRTHAPQYILLIQVLGSLLFLIDPHSGWINALAYVVSLSPFFGIYSYNFALKQTDTNRNDEAALSNYTLILSGSLGTLFGGWLLQKDLFLTAVVLGCLGGMWATYMMHMPLPPKDYIKRTRVRLGWKKPSNRLTFMSSANSVLVDGCLPMWMNVIGIGPLAAAINMAIRPFLGFFLTPLFSYLMNKGTYRTVRYITVLLGLGWIAMAGAYFHHILIPIGLTVLMAATNLMAPLEMNRWFKRRSVSATIAREGLLLTGRLPSYLVGIPLIFAAPYLFPILGFFVGSFFAYSLLYHKRSLRTRLSLWISGIKLLQPPKKALSFFQRPK